ncbi:MAG: hypothetical protein WEB57_13480 [Pseudohongiellaceae bacterium]
MDERAGPSPGLPAVPGLPASPPLVEPAVEVEAVEEEPLLPDGLCRPGKVALEPADPPPDDGIPALGEEDPDEPELDALELELELDEPDELEPGEPDDVGLGMEGLDGMLEGCCRELVSQALSNRLPTATSNKARRGRP